MKFIYIKESKANSSVGNKITLAHTKHRTCSSCHRTATNWKAMPDKNHSSKTKTFIQIT